MGKPNHNFGVPSFTPRERLILRGLHLRRLVSDRWLRWRYRDRVRFGRGVRVDPGAMVVAGLGAVELGEGTIIERGIHRTLFHLEPDSKVTIGAGSWLQLFDDGIVFSVKQGAEIVVGESCWFSGGIFGASKKITIGDHTLIGYGSLILDSDLHRIDNHSPLAEAEPVTIGSHVWAPSYVTVLKGVTIGDHCVIGTGSLVTDDIPENSFAAGRPAKVIRKIGDRDKVE